MEPYNLLLLLTWRLPILPTPQAAAPGTISAAFHILDRHSKIGASSATPTRSALCLLRLSQFQRTWEGRGDGCGGGAGSADGADVAEPLVIMPRPFPFPGPGSFLFVRRAVQRRSLMLTRACSTTGEGSILLRPPVSRALIKINQNTNQCYQK